MIRKRSAGNRGTISCAAESLHRADADIIKMDRDRCGGGSPGANVQIKASFVSKFGRVGRHKAAHRPVINKVSKFHGFRIDFNPNLMPGAVISRKFTAPEGGFFSDIITALDAGRLIVTITQGAVRVIL